VYLGIFGLSGMFWQVFIKFVLETGHGAPCLATDIYWKAVEKLLIFKFAMNVFNVRLRGGGGSC